MDTIYALATARGKAGVAVIRVSGLRAFEAAEKLAGPLPEPRQAGLRQLTARDGTHLDEALFRRGAEYRGRWIADDYRDGTDRYRFAHG